MPGRAQPIITTQHFTVSPAAVTPAHSHAETHRHNPVPTIEVSQEASSSGPTPTPASDDVPVKTGTDTGSARSSKRMNSSVRLRNEHAKLRGSLIEPGKKKPSFLDVFHQVRDPKEGPGEEDGKDVDGKDVGGKKRVGGKDD